MGGKRTEAWSLGGRWVGSGLLSEEAGNNPWKGEGLDYLTEMRAGLTQERRGVVPCAESRPDLRGSCPRSAGRGGLWKRESAGWEV